MSFEYANATQNRKPDIGLNGFPGNAVHNAISYIQPASMKYQTQIIGGAQRQSITEFVSYACFSNLGSTVVLSLQSHFPTPATLCVTPLSAMHLDHVL